MGVSQHHFAHGLRERNDVAFTTGKARAETRLPFMAFQTLQFPLATRTRSLHDEKMSGDEMNVPLNGSHG